MVLCHVISGPSTSLPLSIRPSVPPSLFPSLPPSPQGFLVVETNFRCYAYTASQLQTEILALFMR